MFLGFSLFRHNVSSSPLEDRCTGQTGSEQAAANNVLRALNANVFFGYWSVCADGQGFGYGKTYPSLDGPQMSDALLWPGQVDVVKANRDYVRSFQRQNVRLPLASPTYIQNADVIYRCTPHREWLLAQLPWVNLAAEYLASPTTQQTPRSPTVTGSHVNPVHANAIELDADGNILLSSRHLDEITKINRATGDIM